MPPQHPFQCIQCLRNVGPDQKTFIVAAAGPYIYAFDAVTGVNTAVWPADEQQGANETDEGVEGPPGKRRRLTPPAEGEGKTEEGESKKTAEGKQKEAAKPSVTVLAVSHHDGYIVASTAEDKCVRVFQVDSQGRLNNYSDDR
ncbi:tRNA (guanine-N(7)-)-methyltransferase non-catalytic subunit trm82, partial [Ascosphaera atra]